MILQWLEVVPEVLSKMYSLPWLYFRSTTNSSGQHAMQCSQLSHLYSFHFIRSKYLLKPSLKPISRFLGLLSRMVDDKTHPNRGLNMARWFTHLHCRQVAAVEFVFHISQNNRTFSNASWSLKAMNQLNQICTYSV